MQGISRREFAERDGCDEAFVRRKIKSGHLTILEDGSLDPALVGGDWRKRKPIQEEQPEDDLKQTAKDIVSSSSFVIPSKAESEAKKEAYLAELRKLEYDREAGLVVERSEVMAIIIDELASVRSQLSHLPSRAAPKIKLAKHTAEIKAILEQEVAKVLDLLTADVQSK